MTPVRIVPLALALTLITACGYKGPLYLPESKPDARKPGTALPDPVPERPLPSEAAPAPK